MLTRTAAAIVVVLLSGFGIAAQQRPIRVYMVPVIVPEFKDINHPRLVDSHADVLKHLTKSKALTLIDTPDGADIIIELVSAQMEDSGQTHTSRNIIGTIVLPSTTTEPILLRTVRLKMTVGDYEREFKGEYGFWNASASEAVRGILLWVGTNRQQLLAR